MKKILIISILLFSFWNTHAQNSLNNLDLKRAENLKPKCQPFYDSLEFSQYYYDDYIIGILECSTEDKIFIYRKNYWDKIEIITDSEAEIMKNRKKVYIDAIIPNGHIIDIFIKQFICDVFNNCTEKKYWYEYDTNTNTKIATYNTIVDDL